MEIIDACQDDAESLAALINVAGEGIPYYLWSQMALEGESPLEVGKRRASRDEGGFSYRNARVAVTNNQICGMVISYPLPDPYDLSDINDYPDFLKPLVRLEALVPGSWYINAIAVFDTFQGRGYATKMIHEAEQKARDEKFSLMSIIVASENLPAKQLYLKLGYQVTNSEAVISFPNAIHGGNWELMTKSLT